MMNDEVSTWRQVQALMNYQRGIETDEKIFYMTLQSAIKNRLWERYYVEMYQKFFSQPGLVEFIKADIPKGIGTTPEWIYGQLSGVANINPIAAETKQLLDAQLAAEGYDIEGHTAAAAVEVNKPGARNGQAGRGRPSNSFDDVKPNVADTGGGNSISYLASRLNRDHKDIADAVSRGEFKSMRAAAIAAGIVKPPTPLDMLKKAWAKASPGERDSFLAFVHKP